MSKWNIGLPELKSEGEIREWCRLHPCILAIDPLYDLEAERPHYSPNFKPTHAQLYTHGLKTGFGLFQFINGLVLNDSKPYREWSRATLWIDVAEGTTAKNGLQCYPISVEEMDIDD